MANFTPVRLSGFWTLLSVVEPDELKKIDENLVKAPNFAEGGIYVPSSFITVGQAGFQLDGTGHEIAATTGRLTVQTGAEIRLAAGSILKAQSGGNVKIESGGSLDVFGACTFKSGGGFTIDSGSTCTMSSGGTLTCASGSTTNLSGTTLVRGAMTIKSSGGPGSLTVEAGCTTTVAGTFTGSGASAAIAGTFLQQAILDHNSGPGRIKWRIATLTDASQTITIASHTIVKINNTCAANRVVSVSTTTGTPKDGDWMYVYRSTPESGTISDGGTHSVQLESDTGDVLFIFSTASDRKRAGVLIMFNETAGDWEPVFWNNLGGTGTGLFGD